MPFYPVGPSVLVISRCKENKDLCQLVAEVKEKYYYYKRKLNAKSLLFGKTKDLA